MKSYFQHLIDEIILDYPLCWARRYSKWKFIYQLTFNVPVIYLLFEYYAIFSYATFNATLFSRFFYWKCTAIEIKLGGHWLANLGPIWPFSKCGKIMTQKNEDIDMFVHILGMITWLFFKNIILNTSRLRLWEISETA